MIRQRLNSTLDVLRPSRTPDGAGGSTEQLVSAGTIRAQVNQPSAEERLAAAQLGANLTHVVHTIAMADVERGDRLDTGGPQLLVVVAVLTDSRRTYKRLECEVTQSE